MGLFLGALCITGALGFLVGLLVGTCSTIFVMAGRTIRDPEVDHPVSEETDEVSKGSRVSKSSQVTLACPNKSTDYVERPQSLPGPSVEPPVVSVTEDHKEDEPGPQESQKGFQEEEESKGYIFLLKGHLAIQAGWAITATECRRLIQGDTYTMRRACSECGFANGQRLLAQADRVWYAGPPSEVYHRLQECGKLKCARHVKTAQVCQCKECWTATYRA